MRGSFRGKKLDLTLLLFYPLVAAWVSFQFNANALASIFLFFGVPALHLSLRKPSLIKKAFFFALFSVPVMTFVDYIAETTHTWSIPSSVISFKLFNIVSLEAIMWAFLPFYTVVAFYEYFLKNHAMERILFPRTKIFFSLILGAFVLFLSLLIFHPNLLLIPYWYLVLGILFVIPPIIFEEIRFPHVFLKIIKAAVYFTYLNFVYEIVALKLGWWSFPGIQYLGWISFWGVKFPFEELLFWILFLSCMILSYYEYFDDTEN